MWQADWLGQNALPGLPYQTDSVVHHCGNSFSGRMLWGAVDNGTGLKTRSLKNANLTNIHGNVVGV